MGCFSAADLAGSVGSFALLPFGGISKSIAYKMKRITERVSKCTGKQTK